MFLLLNPSGLRLGTNKKGGGDKSNFLFVFFPAPCGLFYPRLPHVETRSPAVREAMWKKKNTGASAQHDKQMTLGGKTLSSAQFIQMKRPSVPYQLTAFNQTLSTPSIIHPVCDSQLHAVFFSFFSKDISAAVLPRGPGSCCRPHRHRHHHRSTQLSEEYTPQPVGRCRNTTQHDKLPWEGKTYTNMSMHKILKRK